MSRRVPYPDDDAVPVIVPRNDRALVPTSPERIQQLARPSRQTVERHASTTRPLRWFVPDRKDFTARVVNTACALCRGWCCRGGGDDGFLDEATLARCPHGQMSATDVMRCTSSVFPKSATRTCAFSTGARAARWIALCGRTRVMLTFATVCMPIYAAANQTHRPSSSPPKATICDFRRFWSHRGFRLPWGGILFRPMSPRAASSHWPSFSHRQRPGRRRDLAACDPANVQCAKVSI